MADLKTSYAAVTKALKAKAAERLAQTSTKASNAGGIDRVKRMSDVFRERAKSDYRSLGETTTHRPSKKKG